MNPRSAGSSGPRNTSDDVVARNAADSDENIPGDIDRLVAIVVRRLETKAEVSLGAHRRNRVESRVRALHPKDADAVDRLDRRISASAMNALHETSGSLRTLSSEFPAMHDLLSLDLDLASRARRLIEEAARSAAALATSAEKHVLAGRPRHSAEDYAIYLLAECWKIAAGKWPETKRQQLPVPHSATGAVKVVDSGPFSEWATEACRFLRGGHPAAKGGTAQITDALRRMRDQGFGGDAAPHPQLHRD